MPRVGERSSRAETLLRLQAEAEFTRLCDLLERAEQAERDLFEAEVMLGAAQTRGADSVTLVILERAVLRCETKADRAHDAVIKARRAR